MCSPFHTSSHPYMTFGAKMARKILLFFNFFNQPTPTQASGYNAQRFALYVLIRWLQSALIPLCYDAKHCRGRRVLNPPHESTHWIQTLRGGSTVCRRKKQRTASQYGAQARAHCPRLQQKYKKRCSIASLLVYKDAQCA